MKVFLKIYTQSDDHQFHDVLEIQIKPDAKINIENFSNALKESIKKLES